MTTPRIFGTLEDGTDVHAIDISGGGLSVTVLTWGAVLQDIRLEGHTPPLLLGYPDIAAYVADNAFFGAVPGRYANRIANARFTLDGQTYQVDANEAPNHLHGGGRGTATSLWTLIEHGPDFVTLGCELPDGHMGFPGNLSARCTYRLEEGGALHFIAEATSDKATPCNFTQHAYFNLEDGGRSHVRTHTMQVAAQSYLPTNDQDIPVDGPAPVEGTPYDFRTPRRIGLDDGATAFGYDFNFCLSEARQPLREVATLTAPHSGVSLHVETTEVGLQFYTAQKLQTGAAGLIGQPYQPYAGFCLEPQTWPDSPNHPEYPSCILRPAETYRHETIYRFERS